MIINKMAKFFIKLILLSHVFLFTSQLNANDHKFGTWLENFKKIARSEGVSESTLNDTLRNVKFLPKVLPLR